MARKGQERFYISVFGKPTIDLGNFNLNSNILIYYQKPQFSRNRNKFNNGLVYELSDEFDEQYNIALNEAILFPNKFIKDNKQFDLFLEDIKINAFVVHDTSGNTVRQSTYHSAKLSLSPSNRQILCLSDEDTISHRTQGMARFR